MTSRHDVAQRVNLFKLLVSVLLCQFAGVIGSIFTASSLENWYLLLEKSTFTPQSWVFFPAWNIFYTLMGISLYLIWNKGLQEQEIRMEMLIFGIQLGLNVLWSFSLLWTKISLLCFCGDYFALVCNLRDNV